MQEPPPVSALLVELADFAVKIQQALAPDEIDWQWRPAEDEWSLTEVACHLRDVEREVHQPRFRDLIASDNAFLPGATSDEWVRQRQYQRQDGRLALKDFVIARSQTVALLHGLDEETWERQGRHAFFGPTTMHELLNLAVKHDQAHWQQIIMLLGVSSSYL
jgi:hypothetical protein